MPTHETARITASAPILLVTDVVASANYFRDCVGFNYDRFWGEPPHFCITHRDGYFLMLAKVDDAAKVTPYWKIVDKMWNAYFWVDDAEAMYQELRGRGAIIDYELCTQPYHVREFGIQSPDGHDIAFGQVLK